MQSSLEIALPACEAELLVAPGGQRPASLCEKAAATAAVSPAAWSREVRVSLISGGGGLSMTFWIDGSSRKCG